MSSSDLDGPALERRAQKETPSWGLWILLGGLVLAWALVLRRFDGGNVYPVLGPLASFVLFVLIAVRHRALKQWLRPTLANILSGVLIGVAMTLCTYPLFRLGIALFPVLRGEVASLYAAAASTTPTRALLWLALIIVAEELLWRGVLLDVARKSLPAWAAVGVSVATYALAQLGTGSWLVAVIAAGCGALWTLQRHLTGSLLSPLLSHAIWTPTIIVLVPVI